MRRLGTIALALGDERTRLELIPFISESNDDEDEVLLSLAEELGNFVPYVGGSEYAQVLLPPLEDLCSVEETVVRERAVQSLIQISEQMPASSLEKQLLPLVKVRLLQLVPGHVEYQIMHALIIHISCSDWPWASGSLPAYLPVDCYLRCTPCRLRHSEGSFKVCSRLCPRTIPQWCGALQHSAWDHWRK